MEYVVVGVIVVVVSFWVVRRSDPSRLEQKRLENIRKLSEDKDQGAA